MIEFLRNASGSTVTGATGVAEASIRFKKLLGAAAAGCVKEIVSKTAMRNIVYVGR
jgi:3,4-dihydroxy-2-butanone 4-phosphate synthase